MKSLVDQLGPALGLGSSELVAIAIVDATMIEPAAGHERPNEFLGDISAMSSFGERDLSCRYERCRGQDVLAVQIGERRHRGNLDAGVIRDVAYMTIRYAELFRDRWRRQALSSEIADLTPRACPLDLLGCVTEAELVPRLLDRLPRDPEALPSGLVGAAVFA